MFFVDRFYFNAWRDFPVVPDGEVDIAFDEAGPELFIRGFQNAECDARVLVPEFLQDGRKKGPAADIADADTQFSCFSSAMSRRERRMDSSSPVRERA